MKKSSVIILVVLALGLGVAGGIWAPRWLGATAQQTASVAAPKTAAPRVEAAVRVALTDVVDVPFPRGVSAVGSLRSDESVVLRPEVAGRVQALHFQEGAMVKKGQVLVSLDDAIPRAELAQARASLNLAQSQFQRSQALLKQNFISQQARDEASSAFRAQQANVALAQARLDKMVIRAPFDGMVGLRAISIGDYVNQGQDLAPLVAINPLKVDFRVPEMYLSRIKPGQTLTIRLDALQGAQRQGEVYAVSPVVEASGRSVLLRAIVNNDDGALRAGMFARVQLIFNQDMARVIPETALAPSGEAQYVFRVRDGIAQRIQVDVGERRDGQIEILKGLESGDKVVVSGLQRVIDGGPVEALEPGV